MTNKSSSKQHGLATHNLTRPKTSISKRKNKGKAAILRDARQTELKKLLQK